MVRYNCLVWYRIIFIIILMITSPPRSLADATDTLRIELDMRSAIKDGWFDPASETVGVRGDVPPLSWGQTCAATDPDHDGIFTAAIPLTMPANSLTLSCKIKVDGTENPNDGWQEGRNHLFTLYRNASNQLKLAWQDKAAPPPSTLTGHVEVIKNFKSDSLKPRDLYIYVPPDYFESNKHYPVLYMHDGQNLFDASSVGQEWGLDEAAEALIKRGEIEPLIIVGVGNTEDRMAEYTPTRSIWHHEFQRVAPPNTTGELAHLTGSFVTSGGDRLKVDAHQDTLFVMLPSFDAWQPTERLSERQFLQPRSGITLTFEGTDSKTVDKVSADKPPRGGGGEAYGDFLINRLKPFIDKKFRTRPDRQWTALGGSSLGGLITMHLGMRHPDVFGNLLVLSPSVWWDDRVLLKNVAALEAPHDQFIFLYVGTGETESTVKNAVMLRDALLQQGRPEHSVVYIESAGAGHNERAWSAQADNILRFLFKN